jgi:hypothetical protein
MGPNLTIESDTPVSMSTVGAALRPLIEFPFNFNFINTNAAAVPARQAASSSTPNNKTTEAGAPDPGLALAITGGVLTWLGLLLVWGGIWAYSHFFVGTEVSKLEDSKNAKTAEIASLNAEVAEFKKKHALELSILDVVNTARMRNAMYVQLAEDLQSKAPAKLWIQTVKADDALDLEGKAMTDKAVLNFSRSFDGSPYASAIMVNEIKEEMLNGTPVFNFKIGGQIHLNKSLIRPQPEPLADAPEPGMPGGQQGLMEPKQLQSGANSENTKLGGKE